ncbi:pilus assembly protein PilP [Candidatus Contendibacter odensensis]|uniref:Pilus assembly protein PilP n=1 Tax=Candidatus Contendobacter odensis Run_B_J11 TaxID=1400861 RepID=A0A7U7GFK3_9GAMM|nr:pilus assembly protein PilP [Candidatus Contendobacter odensis]CDH47359.1 putative Pilus assembly protein PilP [Candidatus Contendobacter odensis Run_B_J11]
MNLRLWWERVVSAHGMVVPGVMVAVLVGCAQPDLTKVQQFVETTKRTTPVKKLDPPPEIKAYTPFSYTAQGGKDPFVVAAWAGDPDELGEISAKVQQSGANYTGPRPDPNRVREELEKYSLGSLKMMGTFRMGSGNGGELWALILAPDGVVHRVQKNNYLGMNHGKITGITEQRVELKEIVPDGPGRWQERDSLLSLTQ